MYLKRKQSGSGRNGKRRKVVAATPSARRPFVSPAIRNGFHTAASMYAPATTAAATTAYGAYKAVRSHFGHRGTQTSSKAKYGGNGNYSGKFKKPKRLSKKADQYLSKGFVNTAEVNGTVSDPDCVYVGHTTMSGVQTLELACQVILRKLFFKCARWDCTNVGSIIPGYDNLNSDGWRIILTRIDEQTGVSTPFVYDTGVADSIASIVGDRAAGSTGAWATMYNIMSDYALGSNSSLNLNVAIPHKIQLFMRDGNVTNFYHFMGDVNLKNEYVNIRQKSSIRIQNRTKSATGDSSTDNVANNPLHGKMYEFSTGAPRSKVEGVHLISAMTDVTGVLTARAAEFTSPGLTIMKEPPQPKIFWNCVKSSKIVIQPGDLKHSSLYYTKKCQFHKFLKLIRFGNSGGTAKQINLVGKCQLIALEDMININSTELISIAYEVERQSSMFLSTGGTRAAQGRFNQLTESNNPP